MGAAGERANPRVLRILMAQRILLVYENPATPETLRRELGPLSCEILAAKSSEDALNLLNAKPFDVIVQEGVENPDAATRFLSQVKEDYPDTVRVLLGRDREVRANIAEICEAEVFRFVSAGKIHDPVVSAVQASLLRRKETANFWRWKEHDEVDLRQKNLNLDEAIKSLYMVWQPVFLAKDRRATAFEALVRTQGSFIKDPGTLISTAVDTGRLNEVERLIRLKIGMTMPQLSDGIDVFLNIHPHSLMDEQLLSGRERIASFASRVVIEITEHTALEEIDDVWGRIRRLRDIGYRIALDDMGAGFAGLKSFVTLKPDIVKFDMDLVQSVNDSPTCAKLLGSMIALCDELGVVTVGEGVETQEQEDSLREMGCQLLQGYLLGRPQEAPELLVAV